MSRNFRIDEAVWTELEETVGWYEEQREGLGSEFLAAVECAFEEIREAPERWPLWRSNHRYRRRVLQRFPHSIFYVVSSDEIAVVAVAHGKRHPSYWLT